MPKKTIPIDRGIAFPLQITQNGQIVASNHHFGMNEAGEWDKEKRQGRPKIAVHLKQMSASEKKASEIVKNPNLSDNHKASLVARMSQFFDAAIKLSNYIHIPSGNIDVSVDSVELRNLWHLYLMRGRQLINDIGGSIGICFGLKQRINGLNRKKFEKLENVLQNEKRKRADLQQLIDYIEVCKGGLIEFTDLRNRDKEHNDTLIDPPTVSPLGIPTGGKIVNRSNNKVYIFVEYFHSSFTMIKEFTETILGQ
jgi:hypothetical protein